LKDIEASKIPMNKQFIHLQSQESDI